MCVYVIASAVTGNDSGCSFTMPPLVETTLCSGSCDGDASSEDEGMKLCVDVRVGVCRNEKIRTLKSFLDHVTSSASAVISLRLQP